MNNGTIAICDLDRDYAESLSDYFRIKGCLSSDIIVFTDYNGLSNYAKKNDIDILIIHENLYGFLENLSIGNNVFILQEIISRGSKSDSHIIFKYTSAEEILRIVMANYDPTMTRSCLTFYKYRKSKVIGVCSPIGRLGKSSFSFSLALSLSMRNSCLFISFDDISHLCDILPVKNKSGTALPDMLYYFLQSADSLENQLLSGVVSYDNLDIIMPSKQAGTYSELSVEELVAFLSKLTDIGRYNYIVLDLGSLSFVHPLLNACDKLFLLEQPDDYYSSLKVSLYLDALTCQSKDKQLPFIRVTPPHTAVSSNISQYLFSVSSGDLSQFTIAIINEHML